MSLRERPLLSAVQSSFICDSYVPSSLFILDGLTARVPCVGSGLCALAAGSPRQEQGAGRARVSSQAWQGARVRRGRGHRWPHRHGALSRVDFRAPAEPRHIQLTVDGGIGAHSW